MIDFPMTTLTDNEITLVIQNRIKVLKGIQNQTKKIGLCCEPYKQSYN